MNNKSFSYTDGGLTNLIEEFTGKDFRRIERRALSAAAGVIKRKAKQEFKKELPKATEQSGQYKDRLIDAIRSTVYEENGEMAFKVHAMGTRDKESGTFRARFFAVGTKEREKRGSIKATNFFSHAVSQSQQKALSKLDETYTKEVNKAIDKKYREKTI